MKVKYFLFILLCMIFLSGCEVEYNLDISSDYLETIKVYSKNDMEIDSFINNISSMKYTASIYDSYDPGEEPPEEYEYYDIKLLDQKDLIATYKFGNSFKNSRAVNKCYSSFVYLSGKNIRFNTLGYFDCFDTYPNLDKVTVNIKVPYKVVNHNADNVSNNIYTWTIVRDESRAINLEFENPDYEEKKNDNSNNDSGKKQNSQENNNNQNNTEKKKKHTFSNTTIYLLTGLFFAFLFGIIIFTSKYKK